MAFPQSAHEPGRAPRRTLLFTAGLFVAALLLAGEMAADRRSRILGARVSIPGAFASIQPPKRFRLIKHHRTTSGSGQIFQAQWEPYQVVFLAAWQIDGLHAGDASLICEAILGEEGDKESAIDLETPYASAVKLIGSVSAVEKRHADGKRIVRATSLGEGRWLAIELSIAETHIDGALYEAFNLACQSVRFSSQ